MTRSAALFATLLLSVACGSGGETAPLRELKRARSGNVDVVLLSSNATLQQDGELVLEFRSVSDGRLVDAGDVTVTAVMPMAGMAPMVGSTAVQRTDVPGRYAVTSDLSMAGTWRFTVEWKGAGGGSAAFSGTIQ